MPVVSSLCYYVVMKDWEEKALKLLDKSLIPLPQEINEIDWKIDLSEKGDRIARHLSAFSNYSGGGFLVFGISNNGIKIGLDKMAIDEIVRKIGNIARDGLEPAIVIDHYVANIDGKNILFVCIREATSKPVHLRSEDIYESYTRSAGQTRKMTKQEVALAISNSSGLTFENKFATDTISVSEVLNKMDFVSYFDLLKKQLPTNSLAIIDLFVSERLVKRVDGGFRITNLGAILFAKNLDDFKELKRRAPRVIVYQGKDRLNRIKEVEGNKGYASGFVNLIGYINTLLPSNEVIKEALRKEVKVYPELAVRELVANALIHQDFDIIGSGPTIEIFEDRLEIRNPGRPLIRTERFIDYPPRSRNEIFASVMRRLGICEESGTGIDKAVFQCEIYQLPPPLFVVNDDHLIATLYSPRSLTRMAREDRIRACYQHACLKFVSGDFMTNESIRKRFGIQDKSYPIASKIIADTLHVNIIKLRNPSSKSKKHAQYVPFWAL